MECVNAGALHLKSGVAVPDGGVAAPGARRWSVSELSRMEDLVLFPADHGRGCAAAKPAYLGTSRQRSLVIMAAALALTWGAAHIGTGAAASAEAAVVNGANAQREEPAGAADIGAVGTAAPVRPWLQQMVSLIEPAGVVEYAQPR